MKYRVVFFLFLFLTNHTVADNVDDFLSSHVAKIKARYENIESMRSSFDQHTRHPLVDSMETYSGVVSFLQPDRFRIEYLKPSGQFIIAHADTFWFYTPENQQMMRCRGAESLDFIELVRRYIESPSNEIEELQDELVIKVLDPSTAAQYTSMSFAFTKNDFLLRRIVLGDASGLETIYEFKDFEIGLAYPPDLFDVILPGGADLVDCSGEILQEMKQ